MYSCNDSIEQIRLLEKLIFCVDKYRKINDRNKVETLHLLIKTELVTQTKTYMNLTEPWWLDYNLLLTKGPGPYITLIFRLRIQVKWRPCQL